MASNLGSSTEVCPTNQRRIVFLGRTGSGKSASGNNILGKKVFQSRLSATSVTKKCQRGTSVRFECNIQIIDTPGLFDTKITNAEVTKEIVKCVGMTAPGPHAFVLVTRIDRFTDEEQKTVEHFKQVFGEGMVDYLLVLFTRKDDLIRDNSTLEEYLETVPEELKRVLQACNNRCIAFNNNGSAPERDQEVEVFLEMIEGMLMKNGNHCYTNDMFEEAERVMREREEQLRGEIKLKRQRERDEIEKEHEKKRESAFKSDEFVKVKEYCAQEMGNISSELRDIKDEISILRKNQVERQNDEREIDDYREKARKEVDAEGPGIMSKLLEHLPKIVTVLEHTLSIVRFSLELRKTFQ